MDFEKNIIDLFGASNVLNEYMIKNKIGYIYINGLAYSLSDYLIYDYRKDRYIIIYINKTNSVTVLDDVLKFYEYCKHIDERLKKQTLKIFGTSLISMPHRNYQSDLKIIDFFNSNSLKKNIISWILTGEYIVDNDDDALM